MFNDPSWPPLDYIIDPENQREIFTEDQLIEYLSKMPTKQMRSLVVACTNELGETLLEYAVRTNMRKLAMAIVKHGKSPAILAYGVNDANSVPANAGKDGAVADASKEGSRSLQSPRLLESGSALPRDRSLLPAQSSGWSMSPQSPRPGEKPRSSEATFVRGEEATRYHEFLMGHLFANAVRNHGA
jgi:hypothetical protein